MHEQTIPSRLGPIHARRAGGGPPVVFWHSLFVDGRSWVAVAQALAADHDVVVLDGPAHGRSPGPGRRFTIDECALAAIEILDALALPTVDWIGNAWGGHVGIALARRAPQRLRSLALLCSPLQPIGRASRLQVRLLMAIYRLFGPIGLVTGAVQDALVLPENAAARAHVGEVVRAQDRAALTHAMHSVMLGRTSLEGPVPVNTLFVSGAGSREWPTAQARAQAAAAGARHAELPGRHLPPLEAADATTALLRRWLADG
jgi:pimeloyl-ACP methyl ester carboxylesterase